MAQPIESRVRHAVEDLKNAIAEFSAFYDLPDTRKYPPGARDSDVEALAAALGRPLPPSFKAFLAIHDGFPEVDGHADILSASEIARLNRSGPEDARPSVARRAGNVQEGNVVVIGRAPESLSVIFFDVARVSEDGEWTVVEYDEKEGIDGTHEDFAAFLESTAENMRAAVEDEEGDWRDLLDPDI